MDYVENKLFIQKNNNNNIFFILPCNRKPQAAPPAQGALTPASETVRSHPSPLFFTVWENWIFIRRGVDLW